MTTEPMSWRGWHRRLSVRLLLVFALLLTAAMTAFTYYNVKAETEKTTADLRLQAKALADNLAATGGDYLLRRNYTALEQMLLRAIHFPGVAAIQVSDETGAILSDVAWQQGGKPMPRYRQPPLRLPARQASLIELTGEQMIVWQPVVLGEVIGWVRVAFSLGEIAAEQRRIWLHSLTALLVIASVSLLALLLVLRRPLASISRYTDFAARLDEIQGSKTAVSHEALELEKLGRALNRASERLAEQGGAISRAMRELERLAAFAENNPNVVASLNAHGETTYVNTEGLRLLKALGHGGTDIAPLLSRSTALLAAQCMASGGVERGFEIEVGGKYLLWTFAPLPDEGLVHCYALDITEARQAQERVRAALVEKQAAEAASRAKSAFLANMSHEIRTPLTAIIGFSESMLETGQNVTDRVAAIRTVIKAGRHLQHIINEILDLSKIEAEKLEVERIAVPLFPLLHDVRRLASLQAEEKGILFDIECQYPLPVEIASDPVRLKQVLLNLVNNAIKFTDRGHVKLCVDCLYKKRQIRFVVEDTGIGMSKEQCDSAFAAFTQADSSTTRRFGGTGLGLYLSKTLTDMMGGTIDVESEPGEGSRFIVALPCGELGNTRLIAAAGEVPHESRHEELFSPPTLAGRVLLAEDNPDNQRLVSLYVRRSGAEVTVVEDGAQAVEEALNGTYALVLMDMQMPVMDGFEATRELRRRGYLGRIVALTAGAMREDVDRCLAAGCDDYLAKPVDRARFYALLSEALNRMPETRHGEGPIVSTLLEEDPEMADLLAIFLERLPRMIRNIDEACKSMDWATLKRLAHDMKSVGGNYGYLQLTEVAAKIEFEMVKESYSSIGRWVLELYALQDRILEGAGDLVSGEVWAVE